MRVSSSMVRFDWISVGWYVSTESHDVTNMSRDCISSHVTTLMIGLPDDCMWCYSYSSTAILRSRDFISSHVTTLLAARYIKYTSWIVSVRFNWYTTAILRSRDFISSHVTTLPATYQSKRTASSAAALPTQHLNRAKIMKSVTTLNGHNFASFWARDSSKKAFCRSWLALSNGMKSAGNARRAVHVQGDWKLCTCTARRVPHFQICNPAYRPGYHLSAQWDESNGTKFTGLQDKSANRNLWR